MKIVPVILSGGSGTRLWPLSRKQYPKQYLPLASDNTMLQETILRLKGLDNLADPIIVCNADHRFLVAEQCQQIGIKNPTILLEPVGRNTAPAKQPKLMMYISKWINLWVLLFSITVLSYSGHGGQSAIILLLTMLFISTTKNKESSEFALRKEEKLFVYLVLIFFGLQLFGVFYQPEGYEFESVRRQLRALDQPTRWLLLLPVLASSSSS